MPAADTHDSGEKANETATTGVAESGRLAEPSTADVSTSGPVEADGSFVYDPLAPEPGTPATPATPAPAASPADESTVGTGTSIALGCVAGSVVLIVIAILILFLVSVFAN